MAEPEPYLKPGFFLKSVAGPIMSRLGVFPVLTVVGRTSGKARRVPIGRPLQFDGHEYLVSGRGSTQWIRNLRAAGCGTLSYHGRTRTFQAIEVTGGERERVVAEYRRVLGKSVEKAFEALPDPAEHPTFRLQFDPESAPAPK